MSTKHTPGPHFVVLLDGDLEIRAARNRQELCLGVAHNAVPMSERVANVRLWAAAPDLLEALEQAHGELTAQAGAPQGHDEEEAALLELCRAALAKASGES